MFITGNGCGLCCEVESRLHIDSECLWGGRRRGNKAVNVVQRDDVVLGPRHLVHAPTASAVESAVIWADHYPSLVTDTRIVRR